MKIQLTKHCQSFIWPAEDENKEDTPDPSISLVEGRLIFYEEVKKRPRNRLHIENVLIVLKTGSCGIIWTCTRIMRGVNIENYIFF